jgi:monoamine oxidase
VTNKEKNGEDYIPKGGYFSVLKTIFEKYCRKAQIKYNHVVKAIDYSSPVVKVRTADGQVFLAKRVISSLPLGVLKAGDVTFTPSLPAGHQEAINKIGFGVFNKVIVTLS